MPPLLRPEEPPFGPFEVVDPATLAASVRRWTRAVAGRPAIVAVGGRSGGGKTTAAAALAGALPGSAVVHTDDLAWWEPLFEWRHLMIETVLEPLHAGREVLFTPPEWTRRGRQGGVHVPQGASVVVIEGVGATEQAFEGLLDVEIWVQSDVALAEERGLARDDASGVNGDRVQAKAVWDEWMAAEIPHLAADRPWERADLIVAGNLGLDVPAGTFAIAPPAARGFDPSVGAFGSTGPRHPLPLLDLT